MLAALLWLLLAARSWRVGLWWLAGTAITATVTPVTKVAFSGYEIGCAPWAYTGISGHEMFADAVLAGGATARWRLAALIACSRLPGWQMHRATPSAS